MTDGAEDVTSARGGATDGRSRGPSVGPAPSSDTSVASVPSVTAPGGSGPSISGPSVSGPSVSKPTFGPAAASHTSVGNTTMGSASDASEVDETLPAHFGRYTLLSRLATGGMAELFLALHRSPLGFEKLVVVKRILPHVAADASFVEMFLNEARIAATLAHPNIAQVFDAGCVDDRYFIAMEHIEGADLRMLVREMRRTGITEFPLDVAIGIILGVCAGLAYAHERHDLDNLPLQIVHRDVSPQNIVVSLEGDVKLVDFGIAQSATDANAAQTSLAVGRLKGKAPYMSPEQARGEVVDARSDVFSTGILLFELTTSKRLFKGTTDRDTLHLICDCEYPRPSAVRPGYPPALEAILLRALARDRHERYASAVELMHALEEFVHQERLVLGRRTMRQFMRGLVAEPLRRDRELLSQGRQLALTLDRPSERPSERLGDRPSYASGLDLPRLSASRLTFDDPAEAGVASTGKPAVTPGTLRPVANSVIDAPSTVAPGRRPAVLFASVALGTLALVVLAGLGAWIGIESQRSMASEAPLPPVNLLAHDGG